MNQIPSAYVTTINGLIFGVYFIMILLLAI